MPKIDIIVPVFNRVQLLRECLQSLQQQTFRDFAVIVIDDGSTENIQAAVSAFPVIYLRQERQGPVYARNRGLEMATGQYIAFLDSDDTLTRDSPEKRVAILDQSPEVGFCYGQAYTVDNDNRILSFPRLPLKSSIHSGETDIRNYLIFGNYYYTSTIMVRRSCLHETGWFNARLNSGSEDIELWIRLAKRYKVAYIAEPLARYRYHTQNFCHSRAFSEWESSNSLILESILRDTDIGPGLVHLRPHAYYRLYYLLSVRAKNRGKIIPSLKYFFKALRVHPRGTE